MEHSLNVYREIENENLASRSKYFFRLLSIFGIIILVFSIPITRPKRFTGTTLEWIIVLLLLSIPTLALLFDRKLVRMTFDYENQIMTNKFRTVFNGDRQKTLLFSDFTFATGLEGSLRKKPTQTLQIFENNKKVIKLEQNYIGKHAFDQILEELQKVKNLTTAHNREL